jgi:catechol 2,3-dioxygenase-like lactoylglutathione lyase family enzyme
MAALSRIAPEIPVSNLQAGIDYYCQKLGFDLVMKLPDAAYAIVERDGIAIHLFEQDREASATVGLHIFTDGLDELHAELRKRGAAIFQDIARKPWGNREFRAKDCAGNILKFTEPVTAEQ